MAVALRILGVALIVDEITPLISPLCTRLSCYIVTVFVCPFCIPLIIWLWLSEQDNWESIGAIFKLRTFLVDAIQSI